MYMYNVHTRISTCTCICSVHYMYALHTCTCTCTSARKFTRTSKISLFRYDQSIGNDCEKLSRDIYNVANEITKETRYM